MLEIVNTKFCALLAQEYDADRKAGLSADEALRDVSQRYCSNRKLVQEILAAFGCEGQTPVTPAE